MAELRTITGSAWTRADQKNRQLWFGLGGAAIGILACAILPGLVAREVMPASWQWPERMAARTLDMPMWEAGRQLTATAAPEMWDTLVTGGIIVQDNREAIERCRKAAAKADEAVRCTVEIKPLATGRAR